MTTPELRPEYDLRKQKIIDYAFTKLPSKPKSFADIGAVWGINAAYTFYILESYGAKSAHIVDQIVTSEVTDRAVLFPHLNIHPGNIAAPDIIEKIGQVDIVLLFDILLHQVTPDWDGILDLYAPSVIIILYSIHNILRLIIVYDC